MRKMLIWGALAAFVVCGFVTPGVAGAVQPTFKPMQEKTDTEGRRGRRYHRRGHRGGGIWIGGGFGPRHYAPPRRYYYYAPPPPPVVYGSPCYSIGGVIVCP